MPLKAMRLQGYLRQKYYKATENLHNYELLNCMVNNHKSLEVEMVNICFFLLPCYLMFIFFRGAQIGYREVMVALLIQSLHALTEKIREVNQNMYWLMNMMRSFEICMWFKLVDPEDNLKSFDRDFERFTDLNHRVLKEIEDGFGKVLEPDLVPKGALEIKNLSAKYSIHENLVLEGLELKIEPGEKIGIVGRTGSGKSSLIKLLWRYLDPEEGAILVDGQDISKVDLKSYRSQINVVTQDTSLVYGTLRENLDPFNHLKDTWSDQKLIDYLKNLGFLNKEFVENGLDMKIEGSGTNLSMGERQVIALARVLLRPQKLIVLDEATSSMDIKTEQFVQKEIDERLKDSTMLIVAHRLQTVMKCDRILVLEAGRVAVLDSVERLMRGLERLRKGEEVEGTEGINFFGKAIEEITKGG